MPDRPPLEAEVEEEACRASLASMVVEMWKGLLEVLADQAYPVVAASPRGRWVLQGKVVVDSGLVGP